MADYACDTMHREKGTLRNAKLLLRKLRGDEVWIPTEALNAVGDEEIFDTENVFNKIVADVSASRPNGVSGQATVSGSINGEVTSRTASGSSVAAVADGIDAVAVAQQQDPVKEATETLAPEEPEAANTAEEETERGPNVSMGDAGHDTDGEEFPNPLDSVDAEKDQEDDSVDMVRAEITRQLVNGTTESVPLNDALLPPGKKKESPHEDDGDETMKDSQVNETAKLDTDPAQDGANGLDDEPEAMDEDGDEAQPEPRRMRTRAQAQAASEPEASSHTASPDAPYVPPPIHPLFLMPTSAKPNADYGLPPPEAEETRRMLMVYVQKQEEVCRSAEKLYHNLLKADRERRTVLRWCNAEGHVGEMSDGEDWCDKEEWGLDEDLKKGEGDEKEGEDATAAKKTRGRRA